MKMVKVESSMVRSIGYDARNNRMRVKFTDGSLYSYANVPEKVYNKLLDAESIGRFMREYVIGVYEASRITEVITTKK